MLIHPQYGGSPILLYKHNGFQESVRIYEEALASGPKQLKSGKSPSVAPTKACSSPGAFSCANCGAPDVIDGGTAKLRTCSRCKLVRYCGAECQKQHWKSGGHRDLCIPVAERSSAAACLNAGGVEEQPTGGSRRDVGEKCSICQESLTIGETRSLECRHSLHENCALDFIRRDAPRFCPICRSPF